MSINFGKLASTSHFTKTVLEVDGKPEEVKIKFRGASVRVQRELELLGGILDPEKGVVRPPEYLVVFGVTLIDSKGKEFTPGLDWWLDTDPDYVTAIFTAVNRAMNPPKSTASDSPSSSEEETTESLAS